MSQILQSLENKLSRHSYVSGYSPSQADVSSYKEVGSAPDATKYPHASRWYRHIQSYANEHDTLPGDKAKAAATYFPDAAGGIIAPAAAVAKEEPGEGGDDDDEIDLFGSDDEVDEEAEKLKQQRVAEYAAKKANKPKTIAKSVVTLDVKPWDDETDMEALEKSVRGIEQDGLVWGASKLVPIGYGIRKLQITLVVEDEKISLDELQDTIAEFEDYVQSSDVQAMQKL